MIVSGQEQRTNKPTASVEKIVAVAVCLVFLWPLAECALPFVFPKIANRTLSRVDSPDGKSAAVVSEKIYASSFSAPEYVITLQSNAVSRTVFVATDDSIGT